jgi:hypothetical protein
MPEEHSNKRKGYGRLDVTGRSADTWAELKPRLIAALKRLLEDITDGQGPTWFEDQARDFKNALLDYAKSQLMKPGAEVERTLAEAEKLYSERERNLAEARKLHAEARAQEVKNAYEELRLTLVLTKAILVSEEGPEALLLGKRLDAFLETVRALLAAPDLPTAPPSPPQNDV